jgi:hypothetical protein
VLPVELVANDARCNKVRHGCIDQSEAVACDDNGGGNILGTVSRCAVDLGGPQCTNVSLPNDGGTFGVCSEGACTGTFVPDSHCEGTVLKTCDPTYSKIKTTYDCAWLGLKCGKGTTSSATCVSPTTDAKCPGFGAADCSGDTARHCVATQSQQSWSTFACGEIGATCEGGRLSDGGGSPPICTPKNAECSPYDPDMGACEGSHISLCVDGKRVSFDCATQQKQCDPNARACL